MPSTDVSSQMFRVYWEKKFSNLDWKFILNSIFTRDSDRKSCDLQWKIIQLAIPTADRFARHKIIDNPSCPRCNNHNVTTLHLLCIAVKFRLTLLRARKSFKYVVKFFQSHFQILYRKKIVHVFQAEVH